MAGPRKPQDRQRPAAKKAAAKRAAAPKRTSARPITGLDLDALEREGAPDVLPYTFNHGGKTFSLGDPAEMDVNRIIEVVSNPMANVSMLYEMLGEGEYEEFREAGPLPQWKIPYLIDDWNAHYGVDVEELGKDSD
jgi:hypothetical protein